MVWSPNRDALRGRVAVVAGATRAAGRGIAAALGEAGATVVCTGRSTRSTRSDYNRAETIEETAELVTHLGGTGIASAVDHLDRDQGKKLAAQIRKDHGQGPICRNLSSDQQLVGRTPRFGAQLPHERGSEIAMHG